MTDALNSAPGTIGSDARGWSPRWILSMFALVMVFEAVQLGYSMISVALPLIVNHFKTDQGGWLLTSYLLSGAVASALFGKCADLYGKRRVLILTLLASGLGAVLCALAPTFEIMVIGRVLQGVIVACLALSYSLIRDVFPKRLAPFAVSLSFTGMGLLSIVTPILVGWLLVSYGFRGMFWFDALWTVIFAAAIWATTPESPLRREARVDVLGAVLLGTGIVSLLLVISKGARWGWTSTTAMTFISLGIVLLASYGLQSRRTSEPIINLRLFRRKPIILATMVAAVAALSVVQTAVTSLLAMTPRQLGGSYGLGLTPLQYSMIEAPRGLAAVLAGIVVGAVVRKYGTPRLAMTIGMVMWASGFVYLAFRHNTIGDMLVAAVIFGAGYGLLFASVPNFVIAATPAEDQGSTAGAVQVCQTGFGSILPVILFAILATQAVPRPGGGVLYLETGFRYGLFMAAGIAIVGVILALTVLRPDRRSAVGDARSASAEAEPATAATNEAASVDQESRPVR